MPENTVYVGRGSRFGNQFVVGKDGTANQCIQKYIEAMFPYTHYPPHNDMESFYISDANLNDIKTLKGKDLACWCALDQPCHADYLLGIANEQN